MIHGTFKIRVNILGSEELLRKHHLEKGGLVQQTIDESVIRHNIRYVPTASGTLANVNPLIATVVGSGKVIYSGPYARYLYYGEVYGPNIPIFEDNSGIPTRYFSPKGQKKHPTGRQLQYRTDQQPLAGAYWFERMKADCKDDILKEAKSVAGCK